VVPARMAAKVLLTAEQIQNRVREMGQKISRDYAGKNLMLICVLQNGFVFAADLIRSINIPVLCQFVQPQRKPLDGAASHIQIHYGSEFNVKDKEIVLVEAIIQSGQTSEFLLGTMIAWGASSVKLAALIDKQTARRVPLQPDYMGFIIEDSFLVGYGMGDPLYGRNLPHIQSGGK
jgi:hypoxanthine phosphoribosyltransferase